MSIMLSSNESDSVLLNKKIRIPSLVADTASTDQDRSLVGMLNMFVPNLNQNMSIKSVDENDESRQVVLLNSNFVKQALNGILCILSKMKILLK